MLNLSLDSLVNSTALGANRFMPSSVNVHPYVKGYFYAFFKFPKIVTERTKADNNKLSNIMLALCESYTPAGDRQIKYEDVVGMGDISSSFITGQTIDRNFSLMFREVWDSPVLKVHRAWTSIIDPIYGGYVKYKDENLDTTFVPSDYKGKILIIQTKPIALYSNDFADVQDLSPYIIKVDLYTGVFPITDLSSMYDSNITDNSIVKPTVQYRFDGTKYDETLDPNLIEKAAEILKNNILVDDVKMNAATVYKDQL